jgi:hypothetical protein
MSMGDTYPQKEDFMLAFFVMMPRFCQPVAQKCACR